MKIFKINHVYYLNKSCIILKYHANKSTRGLSFQLPCTIPKIKKKKTTRGTFLQSNLLFNFFYLNIIISQFPFCAKLKW